MIKNHDIIDISLHIKHDTGKAILVESLKGKDVWLARILIEMEMLDEAKQASLLDLENFFLMGTSGENKEPPKGFLNED